MFQENLRLKRRERGLSQEELASRLHVVRQTISKWEKGQSVPDAEQLIKIAVILKTTVALYKLTVGEDVRQAFLQWERFPFSEEAEHFLESLSAYVELPSIADGYWKMVDRNPGTSAYTNVSLCVYDEATGAAYLLTMDI